MFHKKAIFAAALIVFLSVSGLPADTASFVDLGFSPDGKTYMFAQYGVETKTLKAWADLFVVDVTRNNFVNDGKLSFVNNSPVVFGQDGSGALYRLIAQNASLAERYRIDHCFQGQLLYVSLDPPAKSAPIEFRDFETGSAYRAVLVSSVEGSGTTLKSSFYINVERTAQDGSKKTYTIGTPQLKRSLVASYCIHKVIVAPNDGSVIFVIEMRKLEGDSTNVRFMVEALRL